MPVVQESAWVDAAIQRARSLIAADFASPRTPAIRDLATAAHSTRAAGQMSGEMSGAFVAQHKRFADKNAVSLGAACQPDAALHAYMTAASAITRTGEERLDAIASHTRAISQTAATATAPAAQRVVISALRSQLARVSEVVTSIRQQAAGLATQIRVLDYPPPPATPGDFHQLSNGPAPPTGPIVWCVRPEGTFGLYRCSVLKPNLGVGIYWSLSDDSGGSLP